MDIDEFLKSLIHQVLGVTCFVFSIIYMLLYLFFRISNTKHQILDTGMKVRFCDFLR
jgi:hypothetical protein